MGGYISLRRRCYRIVSSSSTGKLHLYRIPRNTLLSIICNTSSYIVMSNPNNSSCSSPGTRPSLPSLHNITTSTKNTINITDYCVPGKDLVRKFPLRHSPPTPPSLGSVKKGERDGKDDRKAETPPKIVTGRGWKILKTEEERQAEKTAAWELIIINSHAVDTVWPCGTSTIHV